MQSNPARMSEADDNSSLRPEHARDSQHHAHFDLEAGVTATDHANHNGTNGTRPNTSASTHHSNVFSTRHSMQSEHGSARKIAISPMVLKRRTTRTATMQTTTGQSGKTVNADKSQKDWHPGQEPGLDPSKPNGGRKAPMLYEKCQITVVDYSEDDLEMHDFNNDELIEFLKTPQEDWIKCRWINVNGLSWDVIQAVAEYKKLHRLAIEDLVNIENRTKADWHVPLFYPSDLASNKQQVYRPYIHCHDPLQTHTSTHR